MAPFLKCTDARYGEKSEIVIGLYHLIIYDIFHTALGQSEQTRYLPYNMGMNTHTCGCEQSKAQSQNIQKDGF